MASRSNLLVLAGRKLLLCSLLALLCGYPVLAQSSVSEQPRDVLQQDPGARASQQQHPGSVSGKVVDQTGVSIEGVMITLTRQGASQAHQILSDEDGQFS